jgi:exonuclease III
MVKILSLNVGAFPKIFGMCFGTTGNSNNRCKEIGDILVSNPNNVDVICFQEIWSKTCYKSLVKKLKHIYPYNTSFYNTCCTLGSGLVIFSKNQILSEYCEDFKDFRGHGILANKGFLCANIKYIGYVITCHLQAAEVEWLDKLFSKTDLNTKEIGIRQTTQIVDYVDKYLPPNEVVYITGDFNITYLNHEYNQFYDSYLKAGFQNSTMHPTYNTTIQHDIKIIDYCFIKNADITTTTSDLIPAELADHKCLITTLIKLN